MHEQQPIIRHRSYVIRRWKPALLASNLRKSVERYSVFKISKSIWENYTVPISVDTFQESPLPKNLDSNTIRIQLFGLTSLRSPSIRHVHFESNGLDTADCMWYPQP